jgi:hypothetical protein
MVYQLLETYNQLVGLRYFTPVPAIPQSADMHLRLPLPETKRQPDRLPFQIRNKQKN